MQSKLVGVNYYGNKAFLLDGIYELSEDFTLGQKLNDLGVNLNSINYFITSLNEKYYVVYMNKKINLCEFNENNNTMNVVETLNEAKGQYDYYLSTIKQVKLLYTADSIYVFNTGDTLIGYNINGQNVYLNQSRNITTDKILSGYTSYAQDGSPISGTMTNNGELNITPSTQEQTIPEGYTSGGTINAVDNTIDSNIQATNIKKDIVILGVTGTYEGDNINDYIAVPADMTTIKIQDCIKKIPLIDTSAVTNMNSMFYGCTSLTEIPLIDTSAVTTMDSMFYGCTSLTTIPQLDTSAVTDMRNMFDGCTSLTTIPQLDTSAVTNMSGMFRSCTSLSNDSLNNILAMLINATAYTGTKTLKFIGLSETQATICTTLSNWATCEAAGWTTGYETT